MSPMVAATASPICNSSEQYVKDRNTKVLLFLLIAPLLALAVALVSQHGFDMQPCAWCVLQRAIFLAIVPVAALALLLRTRFVRAGVGAAIVLLAASGVASALYQHFVAARSHSCRRSIGEKLFGDVQIDSLLGPVFAIRANCAEATATLLGMPYALWSAALFALLAAAAVLVVVRSAAR